MSRARSSGGHEGHVSTNVTDALKRTCIRCGGTEFYIRSSMADPNSALETTSASTFSTYYITCTGGVINGTIYLCAQCGQEDADFIVADVATSNGTTLTMTNLDASTANGLAGCYVIYCGTDANDLYEYFTISSNTAATPTVITTSVAPHADSDGLVLITNKLPNNTAAA